MDKYDLVLDIIEHPDRYSDERLKEILSDPETRYIYNLLCKTDSAVEAQEEMTSEEIDREWSRFQSRTFRPRFKFLWLTGRAAVVAVFLLSSLVAVAIGIAVKVTVFDRAEEPTIAEVPVGTRYIASAPTEENTIQPTDSIPETTQPILFEDATLADILASVEKVYSVKADFRNPKARELHLYYRLDPANTLEETVEQLNTFEQINIRIDGKTLIIA